MAMVYRNLGQLQQGVDQLEVAVALDAAIGHPDLESDTQMLEQMKAELAASG